MLFGAGAALAASLRGRISTAMEAAIIIGVMTLMAMAIASIGVWAARRLARSRGLTDEQFAPVAHALRQSVRLEEPTEEARIAWVREPVTNAAG